MRTFVALTGVKGSGKTTCFKIIKDMFPEVVEVTLADKLKRCCAEVFNIPRTNFDDPAVKEKDLDQPVFLTAQNVTKVIQSFGYKPDFDMHVRPHIGVVLESPRRVAQYIGTEVLRTVDDRIHCVGATRDLPEQGLFVVTDMRFHNEFDFFHDSQGLNFFPFYVANYAAEANLGPNPHPSEKYVLEIATKCERIENNGTMAELTDRVKGLIEDVIRRQATKADV